MLEHDLGDRGRRGDPLFRQPAGALAGDAAVPVAVGADRRAGLVCRRGQRAAAGPERGVVGGSRAADRRDAALGDPRPRGGGNGGAEAAPRRRAISDSLAELLDRFGESTIENWTDDDWEGFTLQALWRLCCDGVRDLPPYTQPPPPPVRHRDMLFEATGVDTDALVQRHA